MPLALDFRLSPRSPFLLSNSLDFVVLWSLCVHVLSGDLLPRRHCARELRACPGARRRVGLRPIWRHPLTHPLNAISKAGLRQTRTAQRIALPRQQGGKGVAATGKTSGWQQHITRAAPGGLRKAGFGSAGEAPKPDGAARYRSTAEPVIHAAE